MKGTIAAITSILMMTVASKASAEYQVNTGVGDGEASLDVIPGRSFSYFKFTIKQAAEGGTQTGVQIDELGLFAPNGTRVSGGLQKADSLQGLQPGFVAWDQDGIVTPAAGDRDLDKAYDGLVGLDDTTYSYLFCTKRNSDKPTYEMPDTWFSLTMRLPDSVLPVGSYDIVPYDDKKWGNRRALTGYSISGSVDGEAFYELDDRKDLTCNNQHWQSNDEPFDAISAHQGFPIAGYEDGDFVLSGEAGSVGELKDVDGAYRRFSVTKNGLGTWILSGRQRFSGKLTVNAGIVRLDPRPLYSWFKFFVTQAKESGSNIQVWIEEVCLFDRMGNRLNVGLSVTDPGSQRTLEMGQVCWDDVTTSTHANRDLDKAFNEIVGVDDDDSSSYSYVSSYRQDKKVPSYDKPETWYAFTMRVPSSAEAVDSYDVVPWIENQWKTLRALTGYRLMGSADGVNYTLLDDQKDLECENWKWQLTNKVDYVAGASHIGKKIPAYNSTVDVSAFLSDVQSITVAEGSRLETSSPLELNRLTLSSSNGTYAGFLFAETGIIEIDSSSPMNCAVSFENCEGIENLANWQVKANGVIKEKWWVEIVPGGLRICCKGFTIIIR